MSDELIPALDSGERRITERELWDMSLHDQYALKAAIDHKIATTPGLEVLQEREIPSGDIIIRWRTRL